MANEEKFVLMVHKDFSDRTPAKVLKSQFENRWKEKGWVEFKEEDKKTSTTTSTSTTDTGGSKDK